MVVHDAHHSSRAYPQAKVGIQYVHHTPSGHEHPDGDRTCSSKTQAKGVAGENANEGVEAVEAKA